MSKPLTATQRRRKVEAARANLVAALRDLDAVLADSIERQRDRLAYVAEEGGASSLADRVDDEVYGDQDAIDDEEGLR